MPTKVRVPIKGKGKGKGKKGKRPPSPVKEKPAAPPAAPPGESDAEIRKKLVRMTIKQEEVKDELEKTSEELGEAQREKVALKQQLQQLQAEQRGFRDEADASRQKLEDLEGSVLTGQESAVDNQQMEELSRQVASLQRQLSGSNEARLTAESSLEKLHGTDDLLDRTKDEVLELKSQMEASQAARQAAEQKAAQFGATLEEKRVLQEELDRLVMVETDRDQALQLAKQRAAALTVTQRL